MTEISSFPYIRRSSVLTFAASAAALLFALSSCTKKQDSKFTLKENKKDSIKINSTGNSVNTQVLGMMLPVKDTVKDVKEYSKNKIKKAVPPTAAVPVPDHPDYFVTGEPVYMPPDSIQQK